MNIWQLILNNYYFIVKEQFRLETVFYLIKGISNQFSMMVLSSIHSKTVQRNIVAQLPVGRENDNIKSFFSFRSYFKFFGLVHRGLRNQQMLYFFAVLIHKFSKSVFCKSSLSLIRAFVSNGGVSRLNPNIGQVGCHHGLFLVMQIVSPLR